MGISCSPMLDFVVQDLQHDVEEKGLDLYNAIRVVERIEKAPIRKVQVPDNEVHLLRDYLISKKSLFANGKNKVLKALNSFPLCEKAVKFEIVNRELLEYDFGIRFLNESLCNVSLMYPRLQNGSYCFYSPVSLRVDPGSSVIIPTGLKCRVTRGTALKFVTVSEQRSSRVIRCVTEDENSIDSDTYYSLSEGHILVEVTNISDEPIFIQMGEPLCNGILVGYNR